MRSVSRFLLALPFLFCALPSGAQELPLDVQIDMAVTALERAMVGEDHAEVLVRIEQLHGFDPVLAGGELLYFEAQAAAGTGDLDRAERALNRFLAEVGRQSASYDDALAFRLDLDARRVDLAAVQTGVAAHERHDYARAREILAPLADKGHAEAQYRMGMMDYYEVEGSAGVVSSERLYRLAAEQGHAQAQVALAYLYFAEVDGLFDDAEAARWYRAAAEQGDPDGQMGLGHLYFEGRGVAQSHAEAVRLYRLAAEQGHVEGQLALGAIYEYGNGVKADLSEARRWYRMAADQGAYFGEEALERLGQ